jgi:two-component system, LytTR family, sensor histidine kinase AgrC
MDFGSSEIIYLIANAMRVYVVYRFLRILFVSDNANKRVEKISYIVYYIINSAIYLFLDNPTINLVTNILLYFLLTFNYTSKWWIRIFKIILMFIIFSVVEWVIFIAFKGESLEMVLIISIIVDYLIILIVGNIYSIKKGEQISLLQWLVVIAIPLSTIVVIQLIYISDNIISDHIILTIISIALLLLSNLAAFYLFDFIVKSYRIQIKHTILNEQNIAYSEQYNRVKEIYEENSDFRHNVKNHMMAIANLIEKDEKDDAVNYIKNLYEFNQTEYQVVKSENIELNGILNYKIYDAERKDIELVPRIDFAESIMIKANDLILIIGNLLDNAINATDKVAKKRIIEFNIKCEKNMIWITVKNPYADKLQFDEKGEFMTTRADKERTARGIRLVKETIKKYNGLFEINYNNNIFEAKAFLYNQ